MEITSPKNERLKQINRLANKPGKRQEADLLVVEGQREIDLALLANWQMTELYYCPDLNKKNKLSLNNITPIELSISAFKKISYRENPDGMLAIFKAQHNKLADLRLPKQPLIVILENIEKPGNLGAILRTAYALNVSAIIINDNQTDIYNPNVIRASEGHIFTNQIVKADILETLKFLHSQDIKIFGATTQASKKYTDIDFKKGTAIVLGSEAQGLSGAWLKKLDQEIKIPMKSGIDSLNVSVSAAIILSEASRQRGFKF
jgi:RNA methyltransferase, TrmH family